MAFKSKEEFIKYYESLNSDFERNLFIKEMKEAQEEGRIFDPTEEIDRFTATEDDFKIYFPRYQARINEKSQKEIDKNFEDSEQEFLDKIDTDVDFQLDNIHIFD